MVIISGTPLNLISVTCTFFTSLITFLSCVGTSCDPSSQYALYPLYSFGLCDAVRMTPVSYTHLDVYKRQAFTRARKKLYLVNFKDELFADSNGNNDR